MAASLRLLAHSTGRSYEDVLADLVKREAGAPARAAKAARAEVALGGGGRPGASSVTATTPDNTFARNAVALDAAAQRWRYADAGPAPWHGASTAMGAALAAEEAAEEAERQGRIAGLGDAEIFAMMLNGDAKKL